MARKIISVFALTAIIMGLMTSCPKQKAPSTNIDRTWWKEAIIYQIYPRSFKDSNGDGVGDLKGIISELDYIQSLGITAVWLNPFFTSPNDDNGYDVSDYRGIQPEFGTMADFDQLLEGLHNRGIKLIVDLVVNHSSDEHAWFKQSRSSRDNPYRDYYHWWNAEKGKPPYRYSLFDVNHDAWMYDSLTNAYYLHYFSRKQPDLNWENPKLRQEVYDIMNFWAAKGVDGFRLDAFQFAAKDTTFPEFPKGYEKAFIKYYAMQGNLHGYLQEMHREVFSKHDIVSVAEGAGNSFEDAHNLVDADRRELNMAYAFDAIDLPKPEGYSLVEFKTIFSRWDSAFAKKGWLSVFLANHDNARMVSRYGNDTPEFRNLSAKMLTTFVMSMRGTPYFYYGDELGMTNPGFDKIEDYRDMSTLNEYQYQKKQNGDLDQFLERLKFGCRDNGRTPMQWDDSPNAGFTSGTPWIAVNKNYGLINRMAQEKDPESALQFFRKMVRFRKENSVLVYGKYTLLDKKNPDCYSFIRELDGRKFLVMLNFRKTSAKVTLPDNIKQQKVLISNYMTPGKNQELLPYEARIVEIK
jgi:oligo-1,6-glucosidase